MDRDAGPVFPGFNAEELCPNETTVDVDCGTPDADEVSSDEADLAPVCVALDVKVSLDEGDDPPLFGDPDAAELGNDEMVFPPRRVDPEGEEDDPKEDADPPVWVALYAEDACPVENGSRVAVPVLPE